MSISRKTRKLLWAKSGSVCAICKCSLIRDEMEKDSFSIIGDECHIISPKPSGPRHVPNYNGDFHDLSNLLLLCKSDHKMIDDQLQKYTINYLITIKKQHENWVSESIRKNKKTYSKYKGEEASFLPRLTSGKEIFSILWNTHLYSFDYDENASGEQRDTIAVFLETLQDYGDFSTELEIGQRIDLENLITEELQRLESMGLWVFGVRAKHKMQFGEKIEYWPLAVITIFNKDNPIIIKIAV